MVHHLGYLYHQALGKLYSHNDKLLTGPFTISISSWHQITFSLWLTHGCAVIMRKVNHKQFDIYLYCDRVKWFQCGDWGHDKGEILQVSNQHWSQVIISIHTGILDIIAIRMKTILQQTINLGLATRHWLIFINLVSFSSQDKANHEHSQDALTDSVLLLWHLTVKLNNLRLSWTHKYFPVSIFHSAHRTIKH